MLYVLKMVMFHSKLLLSLAYGNLMNLGTGSGFYRGLIGTLEARYKASKMGMYPEVIKHYDG